MAFYPVQDLPVASIHSIPIELLSYIFTLSTHTSFAQEDDDDDAAEPSPSDFPFDPANMLTTLAISFVSRYWRAIALSTPALWTDICVSSELPDDDDEESRQLRNTMKPNANRLLTYLARSGNAPIDILICARDPDWDFSETEVSTYAPPNSDPDYPENTYVHPFLSTHMHAVLDMFMPHLGRWRSLTILTDTCSPMCAALNRLSDPAAGTWEGAHQLESIVLKRCNEYIGSSPEFLPQEMKMTPEVPFAALLSHTGGDHLPRMRKLRLHGVHINWTNLPKLLHGLRSLELSEHAYEVRPTLVDFRRILTSCPNLHKLVVGVSGPVWDQDDAMDGMPTSYEDNSYPVAFPHLKELTLGYTDADDARQVLKHLYAPNVKSLTIADTTSVMFPHAEDAGCLLVACATNTWGNAPMSSSEESTQDADKTASSCFPALEEVTLDRVQAYSLTLRTFFGALPTLRRLSLQHTSMQAMRALMPLEEEHTENLTTQPPPCPCPNLQSIHIRGASPDFDLISRARIARIKRGAYAFEPEIFLDHSMVDDIVDDMVDNMVDDMVDDMVHVGAAPGFEGMEVRIRSGDPYQAGGIDFEDAAMDLEMGNNATKEDLFALDASLLTVEMGIIPHIFL